MIESQLVFFYLCGPLGMCLLEWGQVFCYFSKQLLKFLEWKGMGILILVQTLIREVCRDWGALKSSPTVDK